MLTHLSAAAASTDHSGILCNILLFATVIAFIIGLAQVLGLDFVSSRLAGGRFSGLLVFIVLLLAYVFFC